MNDNLVAEIPDKQANLKSREAFNNRHAVLGLIVNILSTLLAATSMGMLAVLLPIYLNDLDFTDSLIGAALSFESIASFVFCLMIPNILKKIGLPVGLLLSTILRVPTVLIFPYFNTLDVIIPSIFIHALGCYSLLVLLQIWVNSIPFKKHKGLMIALYSTSISIGFAIGPVIINYLTANQADFSAFAQYFLNYTDEFFGHTPYADTSVQFVFAALISLLSALPIMLFMPLVPNVSFAGKAKIFKLILENKGVMFSICMAGVSQFGVAAFIIIYGINNGLSIADSALLLTSFMLGSLILEVPIAWLSDYFDRRYFIVWCSFLCMACAVLLPIAIYVPIQAWVLVFIWGGVIAGIYSVSLAMIGERYNTNDENIVSNAGYSLMESIGGTFGIIFIGFSMQYLGNDGLPYTIMFASVLYFSFALTRYRIE
jgi:MFS family permease